MSLIYNAEGRILFEVVASSEVTNLIKDEQTELGNFFLESDKLESLNYYIQDSTLVSIPEAPNTWSTFNYQTKLWEINPVALESVVRNQRNTLLAEADILIFKAEDLGQDVTALRGYRQALRDITLQEGFPLAVNWPQAPV